MNGLDTNILVRIIERDDARQAKLAISLFEHPEDTGFVSVIVLLELLWVLKSHYQYNKAKLVAVLEILVASDDLVLEDRQLVVQAIELYRQTNADFTDIMIGLRNQDAGCEVTVTFDKKAAKLDEFSLLS